MKKLLLSLIILLMAMTAWADDIKIPTTEENPFDLTMGTVTSEDTHEHFTNNGVEWMMDGDKIVYTLQNQQDADFYYASVWFDTGNNNISVDMQLKSQGGTMVADTTFVITRNGWYNKKYTYRVKTKAMTKGRYILTFTFHGTANNATANISSIKFETPQIVSVPTTDDNPFDLTKALVFSSTTHEHFTDYGVEYMYDQDQLIYYLQCLEDLDICNVYIGADTQINNVTLDFSLTGQNGDAVADTTFQIENKDWYKTTVYDLQLRSLKKGRYALTLTFHQTQNSSWSSCNISSIAFRRQQSLKPGDIVDIANTEFDDLNGWERTGGGWNKTLDIDGNKNGKSWFNYGTAELSQTIYSVPDGLYMLRLCAYDGANYMTGDEPKEQETFIFINNQMKPMKTAFDESVGYRNFYRWYLGQSNNQYRHTADGRWVPTQQVEWNEAKSMSEHLYENCLIVPVTKGKVTFGWKKTGNSGNLAIVYDHASLVYLSDKTTISEAERAVLESRQITDDYRARLSEIKQSVRTELAAKRTHAPQALAEANALVNADIAYATDNEYIDAILHAEHLLQRLQLPFCDITLTTPGTLAEQLEAQAVQTTDTISLKLSGTLNDEDLAMLKKLTNMMEVDLNETTLTALPDNQFNNKFYLLTWVTLPKQLETIGSRTFYNCVELRDLQFPPTLKSIGDGAFYYTYNFCRADIPESLTMANNVYHNSGIRHIVFPTSMVEVPYAFCCNCQDLYDVQFNGQLNIGDAAFENCYELRSITLPEGMERLKDQCFRYCTGLTKVTLPSTILTTARPFFNCRNLTELTCLAAAPPYANNNSLHGDITSKGFTLYVPRQAVEEYQEADKWSEFNVVGIDALPQTYNVISELTLDMNNAYPTDYNPNVSLHGLYYYWGGDVSSVATYGHLTVDGSTTFSAHRLTTLYNEFAKLSMGNRDTYQPSHTSILNNGQMRADSVTVELRLYENCWSLVSFPFDVRVGDIRRRFSDTPLAIYGYDGQKRAEGKNGETWVQMTTDSILHAGRGYIYNTVIPYHQQAERQAISPDNWHYNTFFFDALQNANKPKFFRTDDVEVMLQKHESEFAHDRSWNLIGNPYPCYFDIQKMETTAPIIVWNYRMTHIAGQYRAYSPLDDDLILFPGQAFFIQCPLDQPTVVFHKEGRQHDLSLHYDVAEARARAMAAYPRQVFNLLLTTDENGQTQTVDRTRFVFNEAASPNYEPGRDASKFFSLDAQAAHLYTISDGVRYAINERPIDSGKVQLGLQLGTAGTYTLHLDTKVSEAVTLIDQITGKETRLDGNSEGYTFYANAGTIDNRFVLYLSDAATGITEAATRLQQREQPVYDLQGRRVSQPQKGIYIKDNKKVIIK